MKTTFGINSPQAVKRWANDLATQTSKEMYFTKFIGTGETTSSSARSTSNRRLATRSSST